MFDTWTHKKKFSNCEISKSGILETLVYKWRHGEEILMSVNEFVPSGKLIGKEWSSILIDVCSLL